MRVLFVHQSADLYGSDRMLLTLVGKLDRRRFEPIVVLPRVGPLSDALAECGVETHVRPLLTLSRKSMTPWGLAETAMRAARSLRVGGDLRALRADVIHSNTLAIVSGAVWARAWGVPHVWHVHEIVERPVIAATMFRYLLRKFATLAVCCSDAVRRSVLTPELASRVRVIHNGVDRPPPDVIRTMAVRRKMVGDEPAIVVLLVGRINAIKGHSVLLDAAARLRNGPRLKFAMLGDSPAGQEYYETDIRTRIAELGLERDVQLFPFERDVWPWWDACDVAVVPSTRPEAFGLVAVEAMLAGRPVIASAIGGLEEIVEPTSGLLVPPADERALQQAIATLAADQSRRAVMGEAGHARAALLFSERAYVSAFEQVYEELTG